MKTKILTLGKKNQLTVPRDFLQEGTTLFQCERREDGTLVLTPQISVPMSQAYFWTRRWQEGERKASEDIRAGRLRRNKSAGELSARLDAKRRK